MRDVRRGASRGGYPHLALVEGFGRVLYVAVSRASPSAHAQGNDVERHRIIKFFPVIHEDVEWGARDGSVLDGCRVR